MSVRMRLLVRPALSTLNLAKTVNRCKTQSPPLRCASTESPTQDLPTDVDVVVIGGGSVGCSTAYHLSELGVKCVLLERNKLTSGTTWHTAGLLWQLRPNDTDIQLIAHTRKLNTEILPAQGHETGWITNGGLFIASSKTRHEEYLRLHTIGKAFGIESHLLSPREAQDKHALLRTADLYSCLYVPKDGLIEASSYCAALSSAATKNGAKIIENCSVTNIETEKDPFGTTRVARVITPFGSIQTKAVANCAGVWGPDIGQMVGVKVPLCSMRHAYILTEKIQGIANTPNVRDHDRSVYFRLQGDSLAVGGYEPNPVFIEDMPKDFAFSLFDLDWDAFSANNDGALYRMPILNETGIKTEVCGPESFTPDHKPLLGESPELRGFFLGCGFNSAGMMLGGGSGQQLAQWIVKGRPDLFMHGYDICRFHHLQTRDEKWIKERSHESYAKNYSIVFPHDEPLAGRNARTDPLFHTFLERGCVFQERHGWERPAWFSTEGKTAPLLDYDYYGYYNHKINEDYNYKTELEKDYTFSFPAQHDIIQEECETCRNKVAIFNMSYFGKFFLSGPDSQAAVNWIFSADVAKPTGSTIYTCMLNKGGKIEADLTVSVLDSVPGTQDTLQGKQGKAFYVAAGGAIAEHAWRHINTAIQDNGFDVEISDRSKDFALLSIQGPKSREVLRTLTNLDLGDESFPFSTHKIAKIAGVPCRLIRLSFVGELGYELHIPSPQAVQVYDALMNAGAPFGVRNAGYRAIDSLSLEKGYRLWGQDIRNSDNPLEAGLGFTCKLKTDTQFQGRESLVKQKSEGLSKRLTTFFIKGHEKGPLLGLETVYRDGTPVGYIRRADFVFTLGGSMGVAMITKTDKEAQMAKWLSEGNYEIEVMGKKVAAEMLLQSPFDPKNLRIKGIYN